MSPTAPMLGAANKPHVMDVDPDCVAFVGTYSGHDDPSNWLTHLQAAAELYQWPEAVCLKVGVLQLRGAARLWAHRHHFTSWSKFCQQLDQRFGEVVESAMVRLEQCFQQEDESPGDFADRFLHCAVKSGRQEDPSLLYSFIQRLWPELREEVVRQRLHSLADVVTFCDYWLTTQNNVLTWQQYDNCSPDLMSGDWPDDDWGAYDQQEYGLWPYPASSDDVCVDSHHFESMGDSLEQLLNMQEQLHSKDLEIAALKALLRQVPVVQIMPQKTQPASLYALEAAEVQPLTIAPCQDVASTPLEALPAADSCHHSSTPFCEPEESLSRCAPCQPPVDMAAQVDGICSMKKPTRYATAIYDPPKALSSGYQLPERYADDPSRDTPPGASSPWQQATGCASSTCAAAVRSGPPMPLKPHGNNLKRQHPHHLLAWSKIPKDPGKDSSLRQALVVQNMPQKTRPHLRYVVEAAEVQPLTTAARRVAASAPLEALPAADSRGYSSTLSRQPEDAPSGSAPCQTQMLAHADDVCSVKKPTCCTYDPPTAVPSGPQLPEWHGSVPYMDTPLGAAYPWLQGVSSTSVMSRVQRAAENTAGPPMPPKLGSDTLQRQHLCHLLAWSKIPKDPGKHTKTVSNTSP